MSTVKQLFQLQETEIEAEAKEISVNQILARLGASETLLAARSALAEEQQRLAGLTREQRSLETDVEDLTGKIRTAERDLYSGRIQNPKELTSLQQDVAMLRTRRSRLEDQILDLMERCETSREKVEVLARQLRSLEEDWRTEQERLNAELERTRTVLANLTKRQQELAGGIEPQAMDLYRTLRKQKGTAVARVEQGVCRGCRISLPVNELQLARSGALIQCGNCGRILYLP